MLESPKKSEAEAREVVFWLLRSQDRVLIGEVSIAVGPYWRLKDAEKLLEDMASEGVIRFATPEENSRFGVHLAYVLV